MFKSCIELLEDDILGKLLDTKNKQDYIPLTLAAFCGRKEIFNLILSYQSKVLWIYGDLHAVEYLLTDIDTVGLFANAVIKLPTPSIECKSNADQLMH